MKKFLIKCGFFTIFIFTLLFFYFKLTIKNISKKFILPIIFIGIMCSVSNADITFDEFTASNMVVELEQCKVIKDQIELYKQSNSELEYQIKLQKDINALQKQQ